MNDAKKFLEDRIRNICNLPDDFEITEKWKREQLDVIDENATFTCLDSIYSSRFENKKILTKKDFNSKNEFRRS